MTRAEMAVTVALETEGVDRAAEAHSRRLGTAREAAWKGSQSQCRGVTPGLTVWVALVEFHRISIKHHKAFPFFSLSSTLNSRGVCGCGLSVRMAPFFFADFKDILRLELFWKFLVLSGSFPLCQKLWCDRELAEAWAASKFEPTVAYVARKAWLVFS